MSSQRVPVPQIANTAPQKNVQRPKVEATKTTVVGPDNADDRGGTPKGVVILGMGRSGTSAVTSMFVKAGFFAGRPEDVMGAADSNPAGHWENLGIFHRNEEILQRLGGSWLDPPSETSQLNAVDWARPLLRGELQRLVKQAAGTPIAVKDPRIGVLMELWRPVLGEMLHPVLVVRDPVEIALSLAARDDTPLPFALAGWELHMTRLLAHLRGMTVTVVPYPRIVEDEDLPQSIVEAVATHLDPSLSTGLLPGRASRAFIAELHRNRNSERNHDEHLTSRQRKLWQLLGSLQSGCQQIDPAASLCVPSEAARNAVRRETQRVGATRERATLIEDLTSSRERSAALEGELERERRRAEHLLSQLARERERADLARASLIRAEHWLSKIQDSASWRLTRPLRSVKRTLSPHGGPASAAIAADTLYGDERARPSARRRRRRP